MRTTVPRKSSPQLFFNDRFRILELVYSLTDPAGLFRLWISLANIGTRSIHVCVGTDTLRGPFFADGQTTRDLVIRRGFLCIQNFERLFH